MEINEPINTFIIIETIYVSTNSVEVYISATEKILLNTNTIRSIVPTETWGYKYYIIKIGSGDTLCTYNITQNTYNMLVKYLNCTELTEN